MAVHELHRQQDRDGWREVILFHPTGTIEGAVRVPANAHPKAILKGSAVYVLEAGRYVHVDSWSCGG